MQSSTNSILTGLAVADMLVMIDYIPFSTHFFLDSDKPLDELYNYEWSVFTLTHAHFSVVCHTISTWLTVLLAIWRYLAVSFPTDCKNWCSLKNTRLTILLTYILVPILCIPLYLTFTIVPDVDRQTNITLYKVDFSKTAMKHNQLLKKINFWVFSVGTKLIPCVLLTCLSLALIRVLMEADKRKQRLKTNANTPFTTQAKMSNFENASTTAAPNYVQNHLTVNSQPILVKSRNHSSQQPSDRTTRMLLSVLLLFLITEFPAGIIGLLSGIIGNEFYRNVYYPLGEVFDILALINSAINFILYCSMSRLFRVTFSRMFCLGRYDASNACENTDFRARRTSYTVGQTEIGPTLNTTCV